MAPPRGGQDGTIPRAWGLVDALVRHPGLSLVPTRSRDVVVVAGDLRCLAVWPGDVVIDETYVVQLRIPRSFPRAVPEVYETGGRISASFHRHAGGALCLGSPTALRLAIARAPTVGAFLEQVVIPYLYGHAYHARYGTMPYGELAHGAAGLEADFIRLFRMPDRTKASDLLILAGLHRRVANKRPCPCGSGVRLGRCHHLRVNSLRRRLGRAWFRAQSQLITLMN